MASYGLVNYRSLTDLNKIIVENLPRFPRDIDLVVGIPRSGLLAANLLALHLNLPLTDLEGFINGHVFSGGSRQKRTDITLTRPRFRKVLVIDDSVGSGATMGQTRQTVAQSAVQAEVLYGCVFITSEAKNAVDLYFEICPGPRVFEWNIMHSWILETACVDIDGVLCRDPTEEENDDGAKYEHFVSTVQPLIIPTVRIGHLVTCRLEKFRRPTEQWLASHGFQYNKLIMMDLPDKSARIKAGNHAAYKAHFYQKTDSVLFIESSLEQARAIAQLTGKNVFCVQTREMLFPGTVPQTRRIARRIAPYLWRRFKSVWNK